MLLKLQTPLLPQEHTPQACDWVKCGSIFAGFTIGLSIVVTLLLLYPPTNDCHSDSNAPCPANQTSLSFSNHSFLINAIAEVTLNNATQFLRARS